MDTTFFCVYNQAKRAFLSSKVTVADAVNEPLKVVRLLVSGVGVEADSGLWVTSLLGRPTIPKLFPYDLAYLDKDLRILEMVEVVPGVEFPPYRLEVSSAVVLPPDTFRTTKTELGDQLLVCPREQVHGPAANQGSSEEHLLRVVLDPSAGAATPGSPAGPGPLLDPVTADIDVPARDPVSIGRSPGAEKTAVAVHEPVASESAAKTERPPAAIAQTPSVSITEVIIEKPQVSPAVESRANLDDLFGNWTDNPSAPPSWILQKARESAEEIRATESAVAEKPSATFDQPTERMDTASDPGTKPVASAAPQGNEAGPPASRDSEPEKPSASAKAPLPPVIPGPLPTSTVAQYGMWQVSAPIVLRAVPAVKRPASNGAPGQSQQGRKDAAPKRDEAVKRESPTPAKRTGGVAAARAPSASAQAKVESLPGIKTDRDQGRGKAVDAPSQPAAEDSRAAVEDKLDRLQAKTPIVIEAVAGAPEPAPLLEKAATKRAESALEKQPEAPPVPEKPTVRPEERKDSSERPQVVSVVSPRFRRVRTEENGKPADSTERVEGNGKHETQPQGLGARFKRWLNPIPATKSDRRRAQRRYVPGMVAHYYTGGAPKPHEIADISMSGMYVLTEDRWVADTMIRMTLQKPCAKGEKKQSITVLSRIVRRGSDGVAIEFVMQEAIDPGSRDILPSQATDRFSLARFL